MQSIKTAKYQVFYKNWLGEWVADSKKFTQQSKAIAHSKSVAKKSENGITTVQEV